MEISKELIAILEKQDYCPISQSVLKLKDKGEFVNGVGYLDVAIDNPNKISYILEDRKDRFKIEVPSCNFDDINTLYPGLKLVCAGSYLTSADGGFYHVNSRQIATIVNIDSINCNVDVKIIKDKRKRLFNGCGLYHFKGLSRNQKLDVKHKYVYDDKDYRQKYAFMAKVGKVIKRIFPDNSFTDKEVETFARLFVSNNNPLTHRGLEFREVFGEDIRKYYHEDNYFGAGGSQSSSCMRYDHCQKFFDIYVKNDDKVRMLILVDRNDKIHGRALIWKDVEFPDGTFTLLDRIYTCNSNDEEVFKKYAEENNYAFKPNQGAGVLIFKTPEGNEYREIELNVYLDHIEHEYYPYVDTFHYFCGDHISTVSKKKCARMNNYNSGIIEFDNHYGERYCDLNNTWYDEEDTYYSGYHDTFIHCDHAVYVQNRDYYIHEDWMDDLGVKNVGDYYYTKDVLTKYDGVWYHNDDMRWSNYYEENIPEPISGIASDGTWILHSYFDEYEASLDENNEEEGETDNTETNEVQRSRRRSKRSMSSSVCEGQVHRLSLDANGNLIIEALEE